MAKKDKNIRSNKKIEGKKIPKHQIDPDGYFSKTPVWVFSKSDRTYGKWGLNNCDDFYNIIVDKLISYEGLTWNQIQNASGGRLEEQIIIL